MKVKYYTSVRVAAGWRQKEVIADVEPISAKRAKVTAASMDGSGTARQSFFAPYWESREEGKIKNLSAVTVLEM